MERESFMDVGGGTCWGGGLGENTYFAKGKKWNGMHTAKRKGKAAVTSKRLGAVAGGGI